MERCSGDLAKYITEGLPSITKGTIDSKIILVQLTVGLSYLHENGIVHRDLKPQNIYLLRVTQSIVLVKIADFGHSIKQRASGSQKDFDLTIARGTSGYMAPEVLEERGQNEPTEPKFESDVWSLGIIFFFVLTDGKHPFGKRILSTNNDFDYRDYIIQTVKNLRNIGPVSHDWATADLITQLLQYQPEKRPKVFIIIHHPYFSLTSQSTQLLLAKHLYDFTEVVGNFLLRWEKTGVKKWFDSLDVSQIKDGDEATLKELEYLLSELVI
jgi:serine/threonine-protein kinase/endoribonuclease IRE1